MGMRINGVNMKKYIIAFLFLFIAGCLEKPLSYGCCNLDEETNTCIPPLKGETSDGVELIGTNECDAESGTCNVTIRITKLRPGAEPIIEEVQPIINVCTNRVSGCRTANCVAQVCGSFSYRPTPIPSVADATKFSEEAEQEGKVDAIDAAAEAVPTNFYGTVCHMLKTNETLQTFLKNSKGSFVNTFRVGIGDSFDEFDNYRYLFPYTDSVCNANPVIKGTKDRYMNYLLTPGQFQIHVSDPALDQTDNGLEAEAFCLEDAERPFLGPQYNGNTISAYKMKNITREPIDYSYKELDVKFYLNFLSIMYADQLDTESIGDVPLPAPFECETGIECASGFCNYKDYTRGICKKDDSWIRCSCSSAARECLASNIYIDYLDDVKPTTADELQEHVDAYINDGAEFYKKRDRQLKLEYGEVDPDCDFWANPTSDIDGVHYGVPAANGVYFPVDCIVEDYTSWRIVCTLPPEASSNSQFSYVCEPAGDNYACRENVEDATDTTTCVFADNNMVCSISSSRAFDDCQSTGENSIGCGYAAGSPGVTCNIGEDGSVACTSLYPSITITSCSFDGSSTLTCSSTASRVFGDCEDNSGTKYCGSQGQQFVDGLLEIDGSDFKYLFDPDIRFFGSEKQGISGQSYIGYTILTPEEFQETDFYKSCELTPSNYAVFDARGSREDSGTWYDLGSLYQLPSELENVVQDFHAFGFKETDGGDCHALSDDNKHFLIIKNYVMIKAPAAGADKIGVCDYNQNTKMPVAKTFGWCEPCSYITLAKQIITTRGTEYNPTTKITNRKVGGEGGHTEAGTICVEVPSLTLTGPKRLACPSADDPDRPDDIYPKNYFNTLPDSVYLQEKQAQYLKEGILPVFDATDDSNWNVPTEERESFGVRYTIRHNADYVADAIIDRGPSILIVDTISLEQVHQEINIGTEDSPTIIKPEIDELYARLQHAKESCKTCIYSFKVSNGLPGSRMGTERIDDDLATLAEIKAYKPQIFDPNERLVNVISFRLFPHEFTNEDPSYCTSVLGSLIEGHLNRLTTTVITEYNQKLSLISDMSLDDSDSSCWSKERKQGLFSYLFARQKKLAKSGLIGIIYSDISELEDGVGDQPGTPETYYKLSEQFCSLEKGVRKIAADEPITVYTKVYTQSPAYCQPCSNIDISLGKCNKACANGEQCIVPADLDPLTDPDTLGCSDDIIPEPCTKCTDKEGALSCTFYDQNGDELHGNYDISDLSVLTPDIVSSIPKPEVCCFDDDSGNYTFVKKKTAGRVVGPVIFSGTGDPLEDCGINDIGDFNPGVCGAVSPVKNRKVECQLIPEEPEGG